jgi:plasmid stability protein
MPTITVKNIPDDLYARLKRSAQANRRSLNSEIIVCIERALSVRTVEPDEVLGRARRLREKTAGHVIGDEEFTAAKMAGRP